MINLDITSKFIFNFFNKFNHPLPLSFKNNGLPFSEIKFLQYINLTFVKKFLVSYELTILVWTEKFIGSKWCSSFW